MSVKGFLRRAFFSASVFLMPVFDMAQSDNSFPDWLKQTRKEAAAKGISQKTLNAALPLTLQPLESTIKLDSKQPEGTSTIDQYLAKRVTPSVIDRAARELATHKTLLDSVAKTYGVDPEMIVALTAMETGNGGFTGKTDIVQTLATLAWHGRRAEFYEKQLFAALDILDQGLIDKKDFIGSWAGAFGETQFMPTTYLQYGQDFNNDGKIDLKNSKADAFASAANYIKACGWKNPSVWGVKVTLPEGFDESLVGVKKQHSLATYKANGITTADGKPFPFGDDTKVCLAPYNAHKGGSAWIVNEAFLAVLKWNFSSYYAASVLMTRDALKK